MSLALCNNQPAPSNNGFRTLSSDSQAFIAAASRTVRVPAGRTVFRKGDAANGCYLVLEGALKVTLPGQGHQTLLAILGKGEVFGEVALLDRVPRSATVTAVRVSELSYLSTAAFDRLAENDVKTHRLLLRVMTARLRTGYESHVVQHLPLGVRLARTFVHLAQGFGEPLPDGRILIRQKISQAELGDMIGAARENVNRQLAGWRARRLVTRLSGYYCLQSLPALERIASGGEDR